MNALRDLIDAEQHPSIDDLRAATAATLNALRHDRRIEPLSFNQVRELADRLFYVPDIRTLVRETRSPTSEYVERSLSNIENYVNKLLLEVIDERSLLDPTYQRMQGVFVAHGAQMRVNAVPFRAHVYNRSFAIVARDFDDNAAGAFAVREPDLVLALVDLHARLWREGTRWGARFPGVRTADVDLADVLGELLSGHTDEAAAQHLHVSLRTYRRRVNELLRLLGAPTRFQAGATAEARGYLDLVRAPTWPQQATPDPVVEALTHVRSMPD